MNPSGPERWKDKPANASEDGSDDAAIGSLLRKAGPAPRLGESRLRRIREHLHDRRPKARVAAKLRWAAAALVLLSSGMTVAVAGPHRISRWARALVTTGEVRVLDPVTKVQAPPRPARRINRAPAEVVVQPRLALEIGVPDIERKVAPPARPEPVRKVQAPPDETPVVLVPDESELLGRALAAVRRERDGSAALRWLDEYAARFPHGTLEEEAALARVDALILVKDFRGALAVAERIGAPATARRQELDLVDAERVAQESCPQALPRFEALLQEPLRPVLRERALYGRAVCRLRTGEEPAGTEDLRLYLQEFPAGRFVADVRRALEQRVPAKRL